jgi:hypothetical protein
MDLIEKFNLLEAEKSTSLTQNKLASLTLQKKNKKFQKVTMKRLPKMFKNIGSLKDSNLQESKEP